MRLLTHEACAAGVTMSLRCDGAAAVAVLGERGGWRPRCASTYGEAAWQEMLKGPMIITYVSSADLLTKPASALINPTVFPSIGAREPCPLILWLGLSLERTGCST